MIAVAVFAVNIIGINAQAAVVKSILGRKALLVYSADERFQVGDLVEVSFEDGTQKATLVISKLRRGQAVASIKSGSPEEGDAVRAIGKVEVTVTTAPTPVPTPPPPPKPDSPLPSSHDTGISFFPKFGAYAVLASYNYQSADVRLTNVTTVKTTGTSEGLKIAALGSLRELFRAARDANPNWIYQISLGFDRIQAIGTGPNNVCNGESDCQLDLFGYVPAVELGYIILPKFAHLSLHGGFDVFVPFTVKSNLVDGVALHPLSFYNLGAALQLRVGRHSFIPVALDFSANVWSYDVIIHRYILSVGYGW